MESTIRAFVAPAQTQSAAVTQTRYERPALTPLGTLRSLTKGAGPGGMPIVVQTIVIPPITY